MFISRNTRLDSAMPSVDEWAQPMSSLRNRHCERIPLRTPTAVSRYSLRRVRDAITLPVIRAFFAALVLLLGQSGIDWMIRR